MTAIEERKERGHQSFQLSVGRLRLGQTRQFIRDAAFDEDVQVHLDEERGWVICQLYGTLRGDRDAVERVLAKIEALVDEFDQRRARR